MRDPVSQADTNPTQQRQIVAATHIGRQEKNSDDKSSDENSDRGTELVSQVFVRRFVAGRVRYSADVVQQGLGQISHDVSTSTLGRFQVIPREANDVERRSSQPVTV